MMAKPPLDHRTACPSGVTEPGKARAGPVIRLRGSGAIRRLPIQRRIRVLTCGRPDDPATIWSPDGCHVERRAAGQPRQHPAIQGPDPDVVAIVSDIERDPRAVRRKARYGVGARRRRDGFFPSLPIHPHERSIALRFAPSSAGRNAIAPRTPPRTSPGQRWGHGPALREPRSSFGPLVVCGSGGVLFDVLDSFADPLHGVNG